MGKEKVWITSDPHFYHKNIIRYAGRPFDNLDEMHEAIISNWNDNVKDNDRIFLLGDVSFTNFETTQKIISKLKGRITLIRGNHDKGRSNDWFYKCGIQNISRYPIIYKQFYILSHQPVYINNEMPYVNVHGHIHEKLITGANYFNACVEHHNYTPVLFDEIQAKFEGMVGDDSLLQPLEDIHEDNSLVP